jgi:hypothetical protein
MQMQAVEGEREKFSKYIEQCFRSRAAFDITP